MPLQDRPHGDDGQLSLSSTADRRGICIDNDKEEEDVRSGNDANIGSSDEEEGYDTDNTSSYDSDAYPSQLFIEIRHHGTSPYDHFELPGLDIDHSGNQKRRKLNNGLASATDQAGTEEFRSQMFVTKNVRHVSASDFWSSSLPSSSTGSDKGASLIGSIMLENPEAIQELCNATRFSYNPPSSGPPSEAGASSSSSLSPLLEKHLEALEGAQKAQELLEQAAAKVDARQRLPRPSVAAAVPSRDLTRIVGSAAFPAPTITFRNALEATPVPRYVLT